VLSGILHLEVTKTQKTLILTSVFIAGVSCYFLDLMPYLICLFIILAGFSVYKRVLSFRFILICSLVLVFSVFYSTYRTPKPDNLYYLAPVNTKIEGIVASIPKNNFYNSIKFEFEVDKIKTNKSKWDNIKAKTIVTIYDKTRSYEQIRIGDRLRLFANIKKPFEATNPGQFDYSKYLSNSGIFTTSSVKSGDFEIITHPAYGKWFYIQKIDSFREQIIEKHKVYLKSPKLEILGGVVFGNSAIPPPNEVKQNFINSGLLHLLAASGLNVGLIFGIWFFLTRRLNLPYNFSIISGGLVVLVYVFMTGLPPSILRATGMLELGLIGKLLDRKADNLALLALIGAVLLLIDPLMVKDIGFQLSFMVTLGLLISVPVLVEKTKPVPEWLSAAVIIPIVAQIWVAPLQMFHFNTFATYSVLANITVVPFTAIISFAGFIGSILSLFPFIGNISCMVCDKFVEPFISVLLGVSEFFSNKPESILYTAQPAIISIILFYILILVIINLIKTDFSSVKQKYFAIILLITFITSLTIKNFHNTLDITFFDVGEGDATLVRTPSNKTILFDTGRSGRFSPAKSIITNYLRDIGIGHIDVLVLSHPDDYHIGGTLDLLNEITPRIIYHNGEKSGSKNFQKIENYIKKNNLNYLKAHNNMPVAIDKDVKINLYQPKNIDKHSQNDNSLILSVKYKDFNALLLSDSNTEALETIKDDIFHPVKVVKIPDHGSKKSINSEILKRLNPYVAIISVGKNNHGHPDEGIIDLLKSKKINTLRTDLNNAIQISTNGIKEEVYCFDKHRGRLIKQFDMQK